MEEIQVQFLIDEKGKVHYLRDYRKDLDEFKEQNKGKRGVVKYMIDVEHPEFYQHKYYRGFIVPALAEHSFSKNDYEAHTFLKEKFLFYAVNSFNEIPNKYRDRCNKYHVDVLDKETGEIKKVLYGYTPSTSNLSFKEFKDFIIKCELFTAEFISLPKDAAPVRASALGIATDLKELFDGEEVKA